MRYWVGVISAFGAGTLIGAGVTRILVEEKLKREYKESAASQRRAWEAARIDAETPVDLTSGTIHVVRHDAEGTRFDGDSRLLVGPILEKAADEPLAVVPPPAPAPVAPASLSENNTYWDSSTVDRGPVMVSFAELDEEDYMEEDGRDKQQITMVFVDGAPQFFQEGKEIDNAFDLVGGTIVDDMRASVGRGEPVLWIRNNHTEIDYEVVFEQP